MSSEGTDDGADEDSVTEILTEPSGKRFVKYTVGVFVAVGLGYGVGLLLLDIVDDEGAAFLGLFAMIVPILGAPIIGVATGLLTGLRLEANERQAALTSAVGAFAGFIALLLILLVFAAIVLDNGNGANGGNGGLSELAGALFAFGIGVAVTAGATTFVVIRSKI